MVEMATVPDSHLDLINGPNPAIVTTIGADGLPQSSAVWFHYADGFVRISTKPTAQKYCNALERPECGFFLLDPANQWRFVEIRGHAVAADDLSLEVLEAVCAKHGHTGSDFDPPGTARVSITIHPTRVRVS
jgi:PPOX class probable F420-dependent enzyme